MSLNLNSPLKWTAATPAEQAALQDLQGNILKGHGREHTINVFFRLDPTNIAGNRSFVKGLGAKVTNALAQLQAAQAFTAAKKLGKAPADTPPFIALFLSATGYGKLGLGTAQTPADPRFLAGLKASQANLQDPLPGTWDSTFQGDVDVMLLVGEDTPKEAQNTVRLLLKSKPAGVVELGREIGIAYKNENGDGIEHFGYVDGRSQPLMLMEDIDREATLSTGTTQWDPAFPLKTALVNDPAGGSAAFGSYFVFRKLEQNVDGFDAREKALARHLGFKGADEPRAGAMAVGRFKDGTPVVLQTGGGMNHPVSNDFGFEGDVDGNKCPFHGHIRKANPREDSVRQFPGVTPEEERSHLMARRGITYGKRLTKRAGMGIKFWDKPKKDVGLLFMAYQNDFANQFEFTQASWVNNVNFVRPDTGIDAVLGQGPVTPQHWPTEWGGTDRVDFAFGGFVTMKGGEYLFAPALSTLAAL